MTYSINGVGTGLAGKRGLTSQEYRKWHKFLPTRLEVGGNKVKYCPKCKISYFLRNKCPKCKIELEKGHIIKNYIIDGKYNIATESLIILFLPIIPLKTFVYVNLENETYIPLYYPEKNEGVYWKHVKKSRSFYVAPILLIVFLMFGILSSAETNDQVKSGEILKEDPPPEETLEITPIISGKIENIPEIWEENAFIFRGNAVYYDLFLDSPTKINYEIESIKNEELGVETALGIYIYFLKSEKDFDKAVDLERAKEKFEHYDCTQKDQNKKSIGTCILDKGAGLMLGNAQFDKDAFIKVKLTFNSN